MPLPVLTVAQMRAWERASWDAGIRPEEVIARVGESLAARILECSEPERRVLVLAGQGHNGDDARAILPHLGGRGRHLIQVRDPELGRAEFVSVHQPGDLVIDGLFGLGLNRPLEGPWRQFIGAINERATDIWSIDVPSGLDADTGTAPGGAIRATRTFTLGAPKRGLLRHEAIAFVGRLEVIADIGLAPLPLAAEEHWLMASDFRQYPPRRSPGGHKGDFGHVALVAGSAGYHGAAVLAARGALGAWPGLVTLYTLPEVYVPVASQLHAAMVQIWQSALSLPGSVTAVMIGPGLASPSLPREVVDRARRWWTELPLPMIADASALDWLSGQSPKRDVFRAITPHPGEAARLLDTQASEVQRDRSAACRELGRKLGNIWVVLKGYQTLIARGGGPIAINSTGNPYLAQGGSGDLLAGFLGGLLAQPQLQTDPGKTLAYGVWRHGELADQCLGARGGTIEQLSQAFLGLGPRTDAK